MNQRFMLMRKGENPTWQEWLVLSLIVISVLNWVSYGMWKDIAANFTLALGLIWILAGTPLSVFSKDSSAKRKFTLLICWVCGILILTLAGPNSPLVGVVIGILLFVFVGKKPKKEEK